MFLALSPRSEAGTAACFEGTPAIPVPETINGERIWPPSGLRPVHPLDLARDHTKYHGGTNPPQRPGNPGLELYTDLDIVGDSIYIAFNSGFQVWDVSGASAAVPKLVSFRNGWSGNFLTFETGFLENYFLVFGIDAIDPPTPGEDVLIALAGHQPVGLSIWDAKNKSDPKILYQDWNRTGEAVVAANINNRTYAFFAASSGGGGGLHVYDMTSARILGPCLEDTTKLPLGCAGVYEGKLGPWSSVQYVSYLKRNDRHFIAVSDGYTNAFGVDIHEIRGFSPVQSDPIFSGLEKTSQGVGLFAHGGRAYLALKGATELEIFDVTACLDSGNCTALNSPPLWSMTVVGNPGALVSVSQAGTPYLYFGSYDPCLQGTKKEFLFNVGSLGSHAPKIEEATAFPPDAPANQDGKFSDEGHDVDYWGYYLDKNTTGFSYVIPRAAKVRRAANGTVYVYRAAYTLFDVHEFSIQDPRPVIPGIEVIPAPGPYPQGQRLTFRPSGTVVGRAPLKYQWTVKDKRGAVIPDLPDTTGTELRLNTCSLPLNADAIFRDGFESGNLSRWNGATPRLAAQAAVGSVEFTVELKVTATVDNKTYSDQKSVPIGIFPPADPMFETPPITASSLGEGSYELTAHTNGFESQVRWQIEDANGATSCNFGGGSVRCTVFDWGLQGTQLTHQWTAPNVTGPHKVRAAIRRRACDGTLKTAAPKQINVQVTITEPSTPEVTLFRVIEGGLAHCECRGFGSPCSCNSGKAVSFEVTTDSPATSLEFNWGDDKKDTVSPSTTNVYTHTFASGTYSPCVRTVSGTHSSQTKGLPEGSLAIQ